MGTSEPVRIEVDLPEVILNHMEHFETGNYRDVMYLLAPYFRKGDVVSLHIIMESTGRTREFCQFIDQNSTYKSKCNRVLPLDGVCEYQETHEKANEKYAESLAKVAEESE